MLETVCGCFNVGRSVLIDARPATVEVELIQVISTDLAARVLTDPQNVSTCYILAVNHHARKAPQNDRRDLVILASSQKGLGFNFLPTCLFY